MGIKYVLLSEIVKWQLLEIFTEFVYRYSIMGKLNETITDINTKITNINNALSTYQELVGRKFMSDGTCPGIVQISHNAPEELITSTNQYILATLDYTSKNNDIKDKTTATTGSNAAYKQSEQSSMLYNISVSSLVNIISGILILIYFIGKELGFSIKNIAKTVATTSAVKNILTKPGEKAKPGDKAVDKASDKAADKAVDKAVDKASDKAADKASDKATDKATDKAGDKAADKAVDKAADKASDKAADKAADKAVDKASDKADDKSSDKAGVKATTNADSISN